MTWINAALIYLAVAMEICIRLGAFFSGQRHRR